MTVPALVPPQQMLNAQHCSLRTTRSWHVSEMATIPQLKGEWERSSGHANEAPILKALAPPSEAEHKSSLRGAELCSCMKTLLKNQPTNRPGIKISQRNLLSSVWWTNTSETILWLTGEILTAAIKFGVVTVYFLLSHHTSGSLEATVAGVHVIKSFKGFH